MIIIYPSTHLSLLLDYAKEYEGDNKSLMVPFKDFIGTTIYYMFISGVYTESDSVKANDKSYFGGTYGYLIVFILCLFERICLEWLKNNFGCTEEIYEKIKALEQIICDHESSINSLEE